MPAAARAVVLRAKGHRLAHPHPFLERPSQTPDELLPGNGCHAAEHPFSRRPHAAQPMSGLRPDAVVLVGHGSRDPAGAEELLRLARMVAASPVLGDTPVEAGFLEFTSARFPSVQEAFRRCAEQGARTVTVVPALLVAAGHALDDLPAEIARAEARFPALGIRLAGAVGIDDALLELLARRARTALDALGPTTAGTDGVILVSSGTSYREANADVFKAARLLADLLDGLDVEVAFLRLARPFLQDAVDRCERLGLTRVAVVPFFLNDGLLVRRIPRKLIWLRRQHPALSLSEVPHVGAHPILAEILARRAIECDAERARPSTAVHLAPGRERTRARLPGRTPLATSVRSA